MIDSLPASVVVTEDAHAQLVRDGQARLRWDDTPVDVFLSNHPFHDRAEVNRRTVPFAGVQIPVLACHDLAVFKSFFARPKDVVDVASMVLATSVEVDELEAEVIRLLGDADDRRHFFAGVRSAVDQMS